MKKKFAALFMCAAAVALLTACSQTPDAPFCYLSAIGNAYSDRIEYSVIYTDHTKSADGEIVNDVAKSSLVLTLKREADPDTRARLTSELTVVYKAAEEGDDVNEDGVPVDRVTSDVIFEAYGQGSGAPLLPVSMEKTMTFARAAKDDRGVTEKEKSCYYKFDYGAGEGLYRSADGAEKALKIKPKKLKDVYDSEQLFYLLTAAVFRVKSSAVNAQPTNNFKVLNVYDCAIYGTEAVTFSFTVGDSVAVLNESFGFSQIVRTDGGGGIAPVKAGLPLGGLTGGLKGGAIPAYYYTAHSLYVGDESKSCEPYRLLGYRQEMSDAQGNKRRGLEFMLREYTKP